MNTKVVFVVLALAGASASSAAPADKFKLQPGARGQVCLGCHVKLGDELKKPFVHTPVKAKDCVGCHSPHASSHGKLLATEPGETCATCHADVVPKDAKSAHAPVAANECATCHAPHASAFKGNLTKSPAELCASCHGKISERAAKAKFKHRPVEQGCITCHAPHGSAKAQALLKTGVPELCLGCHKVDQPVFVKKHLSYAVGKSNCTSCHDPHGSDKRDILYDNVHSPVAKGMCGQCHEAPGGAAGFKTKESGAALCKKCHATALTQMMGKSRVHRPLVDGDACLTCHSPHASKFPKLLADTQTNLCGTCHVDTIKRQERAPSKHEPVAEGQCTSCHDPHSSDSSLLFVRADVKEVCGACHDWKKHSSHPVGEKIVDPRNKNLKVECLSCHLSHGTDFKKMLPYPKVTDLCTKCHEEFKR